MDLGLESLSSLLSKPLIGLDDVGSLAIPAVPDAVDDERDEGRQSQDTAGYYHADGTWSKVTVLNDDDSSRANEILNSANSAIDPGVGGWELQSSVDCRAAFEEGRVVFVDRQSRDDSGKADSDEELRIHHDDTRGCSRSSQVDWSCLCGCFD